jgi:hypothetical protein
MEEMIVIQVKVLLKQLDDTKSTFRKSGAKWRPSGRELNQLLGNIAIIN